MFKFCSPILFCLALIFAGQADAQFTKKTEIPLTTTNHHGIAFDGTNWHIARLYETDVAFSTYDAGFSLLSNVSIANVGETRALAYDTNTGNLLIGDFENSTLNEVTTAGSVIDQFSLGGGTNAVAYDAVTNTIWTALWVNEVQQLSLAGALISSFSTPNMNWTGLAIDSCNGNLLLLESEDEAYEYQTNGTMVGKIITGDQITGNGQGLYYDAATAELYATAQNDGITVFQDESRTTCGSVDATYTVGGTVSGLTGTGLALQNNATDTLAITADGVFTFTTALASGESYLVTVSTQPTGQTCTVSNESGTIAVADVADVAVNCVDDVVPTYSVGGTISGLTGTGLALQNNGTDTLAITADGVFTFATALASGESYLVTVSAQPTGQTCTVSNESGTIAVADVADVAVNCVDDVVPTYSVGGTISGLTGTGLALQNNGTDTLAITADGVFTFTTELLSGDSYMVTASAQPTGQTCTVSNESGTIAVADVADVAVNCVDDVVPTYSVGGTISGLTGTGLALQNNGTDTLAITADGVFTFTTELLSGDSYMVTASAQPTGQTCTVSNESGTIAVADVADVAVNCVDDVVPPVEPATPVPTLSQWALILLSMLIGLIAFANRRRLFL